MINNINVKKKKNKNIAKKKIRSQKFKHFVCVLQ